MSGLPDACTRGPRAADSRAEGVYIRQTTSAHGMINVYILLFMREQTQSSSKPSLTFKGAYASAVALPASNKTNRCSLTLIQPRIKL